MRISSIEPNLLKPEIIEIIKNSDTFCPHFHIPLQSGSNQILQKMQRRYNTETFKQLIHNINTAMPDACIGIDVIVGFPGETDEYFNETYDLLESLPVSYLHVFTYSERKGTPAAEMPGTVPHDIRKQRTLALRKLSQKKRAEFHKSQTGSIQTVIPETYDKQRSVWKGWTDNYVNVLLKGNKNLPQIPQRVKLIEQEGESILAELI